MLTKFLSKLTGSRTRAAHNAPVAGRGLTLGVERLDDRLVPTGFWDPLNPGDYQVLKGDWNGDGIDTAGYVWRSDQGWIVWYLRDSNTTGGADLQFAWGVTSTPGNSFYPVVGDWDGNGTDTVGLVGTHTPQTGQPWSLGWNLRNTNSNGPTDIGFGYGSSFTSNMQPVAGDWDGDGDDTPGIVYHDMGLDVAYWYLRNENSSGQPFTTFAYGGASYLWQHVVGDWNGDGIDTVGVAYSGVPNTPYLHWSLKDSNSPGSPDYAFLYGSKFNIAVVGDWDQAGSGGTDTVGIVWVTTNPNNPNTLYTHWLLSNANPPSSTVYSFTFGPFPD